MVHLCQTGQQVESSPKRPREEQRCSPSTVQREQCFLRPQLGNKCELCVESQQHPVRNELITKTNKATAWPVPAKGALSPLKLQGLQKKSKASLLGPESVLFFHLNFSHILSRTNANTYRIYMLQEIQIISYLNKQQITEETTLQLHP